MAVDMEMRISFLLVLMMSCFAEGQPLVCDWEAMPSLDGESSSS